MELIREIHTERNIKPNNEKIYYSVDVICEAIRNNKMIRFRYLEYTQSKEIRCKHNGYQYSVSPYTMIWRDDPCYMVGYSKKYEKIVTFRVDCMVDVTMTDMKIKKIEKISNASQTHKDLVGRFTLENE